MENWQRILVIFSIFIFVIILDLFCYFKTDNIVNNFQKNLSDVETLIYKKELEKCKTSFNSISEKWKQYEKNLSFFVEHDEIEKVSTKIAIIKENIENNELNNALEDIVEAKYLLEHINDKYNLSLKNIF